MNDIKLRVGFFLCVFFSFFFSFHFPFCFSFSFFLLCLLSSSITGFPFLFLEGFRDEAVVSMKLLRVEFHHTNDGWWCIISIHFTKSVAFVLSCIFFLNGFKMAGKTGFEVLQISPYSPIKSLLLLNILNGKIMLNKWFRNVMNIKM